jgi:nicotinamidase-related amidase
MLSEGKHDICHIVVTHKFFLIGLAGRPAFKAEQHMKSVIIFGATLLLLLTCYEPEEAAKAINSLPYARPDSILLELQYRDESGKAFERKITVDPTQLAVVIVDMWNSHGCATMVQKEVELIPLMNRTLEAARQLGIQVVFAPSECHSAEKWAGKPQRTAVLALENHPLPASNGFYPVEMPDWASSCMCPVTKLQVGTRNPVFNCTHGGRFTDQHPLLVVKDQDVFIDANGVSDAINSWGAPAQQELYNLCVARRIKYILYAGCATNMCIVNREFAMIQMRRLGFIPVLVRDLTHAMTYNGYNPESRMPDADFTPARGTALSIQSIERFIGPSISSVQILNPASAQ